MKVAHLTDIHLDHLDKNGLINFIKNVVYDYNQKKFDLIVVSGDISICMDKNILFDLVTEAWEKENIPYYFVLGNHDYHHTSLWAARDNVKTKYKTKYLTDNTSYISLSDDTVIVGHDGWYDGLYDPFEKSNLQMNDFYLITDLREAIYSDPFMVYKCRELAYDSSQQVLTNLQKAVDDGFKKIVVVTHIPPFRENSVYQNQISNSTWLPWFSSMHMGNVILDVAGKNPDVKFTIFCGHSHGEAKFKPLYNVTCFTGKARYNKPCISGIHLI